MTQFIHSLAWCLILLLAGCATTYHAAPEKVAAISTAGQSSLRKDVQVVIEDRREDRGEAESLRSALEDTIRATLAPGGGHSAYRINVAVLEYRAQFERRYSQLLAPIRK